jgi:predicted dehydrogenase
MSGVRRGAIIGFGNVAANGHLPGWVARSDVQIVAVVEPDPQRQALAARMLPEARRYARAEEALAAEALELVDIATPPAGHAKAIAAAARHGVHVLCEKPLTVSLQEYAEIAAAVQRSGVVLHTVHNWKYAEAFLKVHALLSSGTIGGLRRMSFETERNGCASATGDNWRILPAIAGGGILVDHGWHTFYLMTALAGERPRRIRAHVERRRYTDAAVEDTATCSIEFGACTAEVRLTWAAERRRTRWRFEGSDGEVTVEDDHLVVVTRRSREVQPLATALSSGSHHPEWFGGVLESFFHEIGDPTVRGRNLAEAEVCTLLLNLAYASSADGARLLDVPSRIVGAEEGDSVRGHRADSPAHGG